MTTIDYIIVAVLLLVVGVAVWYVVKSKKSGKKCIGCPDGCCPNRGDGSSCTCGCHKEK
ncbi:MAG: FeoB-associated Cys-rich membrane protein [Clostridia bacterium]|nr:FeoB-associated Cys-rich membrane protein [Clostridia bacterium]